MKKFISLLVAGLALAGSLFAEVPAFTDDSAYVIDTTALSGEMKDNVKVINVSAVAANFDVTVFVYDEGNKMWTMFGKGHLKGLGDDISIKSLNKKLVKLETYKYVAIKTTADNKFVYSETKANKDLIVWIFDDKEINESHYKVFDTNDLPKFSDNLRIQASKDFKNAASFRVLVYNDENQEDKTGTIAILKGAKAKETFSVTSKGQKYNLFRYIKIISREEKDFKYTVNIEKNDLVITVSE